MWLTDKEVKNLTRRKQPAAQARVLHESRIQFQMVDGRPVVPTAQFEQNTKPFEPQLKLVRA